jgi:hypothetical protein
MSATTTTTSGNGAARPKLKRVWMKWRARRAPQPELPVLEREPDRIYQLPPGIK